MRGAIAAIVDVSGSRRAQAKQQTLLNELQHRVKNILATINALAMRMTRSGLAVEQFHNALLSRLAAMGRVHSLLTNGAWSGADVRVLVDASLEPYRSGGADVVLTGPEVRLSANAATTLGMVFHEMATNASKYGALVRTGAARSEVAWRVVGPQGDAQAGETWLELIWTERGGPPPDAARTTGFGSGFVTRSVEYELEGAATLAFAAEGLVGTIRFPLAGNVEQPERAVP